jgi:hypothetical protein
MNCHWVRENGRIVSIVAATLIALACGTNVCTGMAYEALANLFRAVCLLSMGATVRPKTQTLLNRKQPYCTCAPDNPLKDSLHLQGTFGNLGMYACGLPAGILVDARGPRWGVAIGIFAFAFGYFPIYRGRQNSKHRDSPRSQTAAN